MWWQQPKDTLQNQYHNLDSNIIQYVEDYVQKEIGKAVTKIETSTAMSKPSQLDMVGAPEGHLNTVIAKKTGRSNPLSGVEIKPTKKGGLENDFFAVMMLSEMRSFSWFVGLLSCIIQITLGVLIILDQIEGDFFGTTLSVPIKGNGHLRIAQVLAILLSIMTQMDLLMGVRTILMLPYKDMQKWQKLIGCKEDCGIYTWLAHILLPNLFKSLQGAMILVASFVVIIQSDNTVDVLKDYSALFVVSTVDNLFFDLAQMGYFGSKLSEKAEEVEEVEIEENEKNLHLISGFLLLILTFLAGWIYIIIGQDNGKYVEQAFPLCPVNTIYNIEMNTSYLDIIGDDTCQFGKGEGTNIAECGWDGGDCIVLNERYPECFADDFSKLGDNVCDDVSSYNNKDCGFDNGDCMKINEEKQKRYPDCNVDSISWVGDDVCNGGNYFTEECEFDGGDCDDCKVENMRLIGNGQCDEGEYNTKECSFDGGDCDKFNRENEQTYVGCDVANIGWIGDGVCNGKEYVSPECGNDGGDCVDCIVDDVMLIGNGFCNGGAYMTKECSFDGGDCKHCVVEKPELVGDGFCNGGDYNSKECDYDGGDCLKNNTQLQQQYSGCFVQNPWFIGDGFCHGGEYYTEECGFDDGDCANCEVEDMSLFSDGICNDRDYNTKECGWDGGDCNARNDEVKSEFPLCPIEYLGWVGDGICDGGAYASPACVNDGGDCDNCVVKDMFMVGDGFCDEGEYNVEGCSFDGLDCVPKMEALGNLYNGEAKWSSGVLGFDGSYYAIPNYFHKILKFDPSTEITELVGEDLGNDEWKWMGAVMGHNGIIYGVPCNARSIVSFDPISEETSLIAEGHPLLEGDNKFFGGVASNNGKIYFLPLDHDHVVKFDPSDTENPLVEIGDNLGRGGAKMWSGVLGGDGNVYSMPSFANRVLKIDVNDDTTTFIGDEYEGQWKWVGGLLAKDGNIYACPLTANRILQINVKNHTTRLVGPDFGDESTKFTGFVEGADGFFYGLPARLDTLLRFDPILHTATLIPLNEKLRGGDWKWITGFLSDNGYIYAIPAHKEQILSLAPLMFRP